MTNFKIAATFLLLSTLVSAQDENCVGIEELGTPNLDRFDYSISMVSQFFTVVYQEEKKSFPTNILFSLCFFQT